MKHITCVFHLAVEPDHLGELRTLINEIVEDVRQETSTLVYGYSANATHESEVHIVELYQTDAVLPHINETFSPYTERFLGLAQIKKLYAYGETTADIRNKLDDFGAVYLAPLVGISKYVTNGLSSRRIHSVASRVVYPATFRR
ncbi:MAG: hypothetical protein KKD09_19875 [Gammaproteobacteria bacterium]|nr:hypothetical protein [Gammaproteobacteria bacterium]